MISIDTKLKKVGNSLGIIVPAEIINQNNLKEGEKIRVNLENKKSATVGKIMEEAKIKNLKFKRSTQEILDELDAELD